MTMGMIVAALAMQAAAGTAAVEDRRTIRELAQAGSSAERCLDDRRLCLMIHEEGGDAPRLGISWPTDGSAEEGDTILRSITLPAPTDGESYRRWDQLVDTGGAAGQRWLVGILVQRHAGYSGGSAEGARLRLYRLPGQDGQDGLGDPVLDLPWDSSRMIRACFSEQQERDRLGACHDRYDFNVTLAAATPDGGHLPALEYSSRATAFPRTARLGEDNAGQRLTEADMEPWRDPECSYTRVLHYNPASGRYEMERPAPDCSGYTDP